MLKIGIVGNGPFSDEYLDALNQSSDFAFDGYYLINLPGRSDNHIHNNLTEPAGIRELIQRGEKLGPDTKIMLEIGGRFGDHVSTTIKDLSLNYQHGKLSH